MAVSFIGSSGVSGAATNGGSVTVTFATAPSAGDFLLAFCVTGSSKATGINAFSSNGTAYTAISSRTVSTSGTVAQGRLWFRIAAAGETTMTCSGTGGSTDATAVAAFVFRGVGYYDSYAIATGGGTTPNSPAITSKYANDAIISAAYNGGNTAAAVTFPTSDGSSAATWRNPISTGATDTKSCQLGMCWIPSSAANRSYNPNAYATFASTAWVAFTIQLGSTEDGDTYLDRGSAEVPAAYQVEPGLSAAWTQYHSGITVPSAAVTVTWSQLSGWPDFSGGDRELQGMIGY